LKRDDGHDVIYVSSHPYLQVRSDNNTFSSEVFELLSPSHVRVRFDHAGDSLLLICYTWTWFYMN